MKTEDKTVKHLIKNRVLQYRKKLDISRHAIDYTLGRVHPYIKGIELGERQPTLENLADICVFFQVQPEDLFYLDFTEVKKLMKQAAKQIKPYNS